MRLFVCLSCGLCCPSSSPSLSHETMIVPPGLVAPIDRDLSVEQSTSPFNIAKYLPEMAEAAPAQAAVIVSKRQGPVLLYKSIPFSELEALSNRYANGLAAAGIGRHMR